MATSRPHAVHAAIAAGDIDAALSLFAPDFTMRSPVTRFPFHGADAHRLLRTVLEGYDAWECTDEFRSGRSHVLVTRARFGGRDVEVVDVMTEDEQGTVVDLTVYARPLDGTAAFAAGVAPVIARRRGRLRAFLAAVATRPLPVVLALGDRVVSRVAALHTRRR